MTISDREVSPRNHRRARAVRRVLRRSLRTKFAVTCLSTYT